MSANESNADDSMTRRTFTQSAGAGIASGLIGWLTSDDSDTKDQKAEIKSVVRERYEEIVNLDLYMIQSVRISGDTAEIEVFVRYTMEENVDAEMATAMAERRQGKWEITEVGAPNAFN